MNNAMLNALKTRSHDGVANCAAVFIEESIEADELAWGLIANAWAFVEREPGKTSKDWIAAAERWRDGYHKRLDLRGRGMGSEREHAIDRPGEVTA